MLMTGDFDQYLEMRMISRRQLPQVELLVAGHHGAKSATFQVLLDMVMPQNVAISVGADNYYGHPSPDTLSRIEACGAGVFRTDIDGTLVFRN